MSDQPPNPAPAPPPEHWVELRIHGVSGTPPEVMLESAHVQQIAGDSWGRFFRPQDGVGREVQWVPEGMPEGRILEGYHWGKYTSGSWVKGLWLILVPFGLVNAAAFMCPRPRGKLQRTLHFVLQSLIRGVGVGVTATFALAAGLITVDLLAYQWASKLAALQKFGFGNVLALGVLLGAVTVAALFALGNQNRASEFSTAAADSIAAPPPDPEDPPPGLTRRAFYYVDRDSSPVLGQLHLAAGFCVVIVVATLTWDTETPAGTMTTLTHVQDALRIVALVLLGVVTLLAAVGGDVGGAVSGNPITGWKQRFMEISALAGLALSGAILACSAFILTDATRSKQPLDFDAYTEWLAMISGVTMFLLALANAWLAWLTPRSESTPRTFRRYAFGMAPWAATSAGVFLAVGFCSAFVLGLAKTLHSRADTEFIHRVAYSWGITALLGALVALVFLGVWWRGCSRMRARAVAAYGAVDPPLAGPGAGWPRKIAQAMSAARLKFWVARPIVAFAVAGLAMTAVTSWELRGGKDLPLIGWLSESSPEATAEGGNPTVPTHIAFLTNLGTFVLIGLAGLLFLLGRRSLKAEQSRRGANVLWDVISFWPHAAHPFVPPAYSQFAVQDVRKRIAYHLSAPPATEADPAPAPRATSLVLSAHSQGSLVALAALLWVSPARLERIGLVTYGSQLQVAYPRGFPAFLDLPLLAQVQEALGCRWVNLYRETDPIAGPVLSWRRSTLTAPPGELTSHRLGTAGTPTDFQNAATGRRESGHDWRVLDPLAVDSALELGTLTHLSRHSGYPGSPDYCDAVAHVKPM
jgi:hypothetical protein